MKIEFRAWDKENKVMIHTFSSGHYLDLKGNVIHPMIGIVESMVLMIVSQGTDRNGKKIFEGDLLQRYKKSGNPYKNLTEVTFNGYCFGGLHATGESEVIGNIYQHPNLLK